MVSTSRQMREISKVVGEVTADFEVSVSKGNHIKIVMRHEGLERKLFSSKTPSDARGMMNFRSQVRKTFNEMKEIKQPKF